MIFASSPTPTPDGGAPDPDLVTPGTIGFLATLVIVILTIFLIRDALRRVRRVRARSGANDAYPIPLRRHVVPNQSTLSGPDAPEPETAEPDSDAAADTGPSDADRRGGATEEPIDSSESSDERNGRA
ncbi:hypothetical protein QYM46_07375 [Brevibacterium sp. K11IcPPYGO002]|uniref:hypothetical protein n=1 Tax=Brevibacterium sp. K11IcPPYGO002 TaxID=3058837 RepID=UPI003D8149DD